MRYTRKGIFLSDDNFKRESILKFMGSFTMPRTKSLVEVA